MTRIPLLLSLLILTICSSCDRKAKEELDTRNPPGGEDPATAGSGDGPSTAPPPAAVPPTGPRVAHDADLARLMTGFGATVKGVHDQASWAEAKPRIEAILAEIAIVSERLKSLPAPTPEEFRHFHPRTQAREAALEQTLGDKNAFLARLPENVAAELGGLAGQFFTNMGEAQVLLRGTPPPVRTTVPNPSR